MESGDYVLDSNLNEDVLGHGDSGMVLHMVNVPGSKMVIVALLEGHHQQ